MWQKKWRSEARLSGSQQAAICEPRASSSIKWGSWGSSSQKSPLALKFWWLVRISYHPKQTNKQTKKTGSMRKESVEWNGQWAWSPRPVCVFSHVWLFETLWTRAHKAPLSILPGKNTGVSCHSLLQGGVWVPVFKCRPLATCGTFNKVHKLHEPQSPQL